MTFKDFDNTSFNNPEATLWVVHSGPRFIGCKYDSAKEAAQALGGNLEYLGKGFAEVKKDGVRIGSVRRYVNGR